MKATWSWKTALVIVGSLVFLWGGQAFGICNGPPNEICESGENPGNCAADCWCNGPPNGNCEVGSGENDGNCPLDCYCGNGPCEPWENPGNCVADCSGGGCDGPPDTFCDVSGGENDGNCAADCYCGNLVCEPWEGGTCSDCGGGGEVCGDSVCEGSEDSDNCCADCGSGCNDAICCVFGATYDESFFQNPEYCPLDCGSTCGDLTCDYPGTETPLSCPIDCPPNIACGDAACNTWEDDILCPMDCNVNEYCPNGACEPWEDEVICPEDCSFCGDFMCSQFEDPLNCPTDCFGTCGNAICEPHEFRGSTIFCPIDCDWCGNFFCGPQEDGFLCPIDCQSCGDGVCGPLEMSGGPVECATDCGGDCGNFICDFWEDEMTCPPDCDWCGNGLCGPNEGALCPMDCDNVCGDGSCGPMENMDWCPEDCYNVTMGLPGMGAWMNIDGDSVPDEGDAIWLRMIIEGMIMSDNSALMGIDTRSLDINGDGNIDRCDLMKMDAMLRPVRVIKAGADGICDTMADALSDDLQVIAAGFGDPNAAVVWDDDTGAVTNHILDTTPSGDDVATGNIIKAGPDGVADTTAIGDDTQVIPVGFGQPNATCILPGPNQEMETAAEPGDVLVEDGISAGKDVASMMHMAADFGMHMNIPARLLLLEPIPDPNITFYIEDLFLIPIRVAVIDDFGNPVSGMSPEFSVLQGSGYFNLGSGSTATSVGQVQADSFTDPFAASMGEIMVLFYPGSGFNQIEISLPGFAAIGVSALGSITVEIQTITQADAHPTHFSVTAGASTVQLGDTVGITLNLRDGSTPLNGFGQNIMMITDRNLVNGVDPNPMTSEERYQSVFYDLFENPALPAWTVNQGSGAVAVSTEKKAVLGMKSLKFTHNTGTAPNIRKIIDTTGFMDIQISYQWLFTGTSPSDSVHFISAYSAAGDTNWRPLLFEMGSAGLQDNKWNNEKFDLSGFPEINDSNLELFFSFEGDTSTIALYLDNAIVTGRKILLQEDFEGYSLGQFPNNSMIPSVFVTSGENGVLESTTSTDDVPLFDFGNGEPYSTCIYSGPDKSLDSTPINDDTVQDDEINSGPDGICDTTAGGDDYQEIPVEQGKPYAMAVRPGRNSLIDGVVGGDDKLLGEMGPDAIIRVDSSVGPAPGNTQGYNNSAQFLRIGRNSIAGNTVEDYSVAADLDLGNMENVTLTFYTKTLSQNDFSFNSGGDVIVKNQEYVVEVSDNGGNSWITIWSMGNNDLTDWTEVELSLDDDTRFSLVNKFLIRWRASMNSTEDDGDDPDGVYIDDILITGVTPIPDKFDTVVSDGSNGNYTTTLTTLQPGLVHVNAVLHRPGKRPKFTKPEDQVLATYRNVIRGTLRIVPDNFLIYAAETMDVMVLGRYTDTPAGQEEDMTKYFRIMVDGPARQYETGKVRADCFEGSTTIPIQLYAVPIVPGLYDPGGGGGGGQTGDISGRIYLPNDQGAANAPVWLDMGAGGIIHSKCDSGGYHYFPSVPVGTGYTLYSSKQGYRKNYMSDIEVVASENTEVAFNLGSGADWDDNSTFDFFDTDKDGDGVSDNDESTNGTSNYDPDSDSDGIDDLVDTYPADSTETTNTDGDTWGDNSDTDDDNDGILDTEEVIAGSDGYITDPLLADTDGDAMPDKYEVDNGLNPTVDDSASDLDGDGLTNLWEYNNSYDPNDWDMDDDFIPDGYEYDHSGDITPLDANSAADGNSDFDGDSIENYHEYWNGTDLWTSNPDGGTGCYSWGDAGVGDGTPDPTDITELKKAVRGLSPDYSGVIPSSGLGQDLDSDGALSPVDITELKKMVRGLDTSSMASRPSSLEVMEQPGSTAVSVGDTTHVTIAVVSGGTDYTPGFGVVFTIDGDSSTGTATILGGEGDWNGGRYDVSGDDGKANVVLKVTGAGTIMLKARIPSCGVASTGRYCPEINLSPKVTIIGE